MPNKLARQRPSWVDRFAPVSAGKHAPDATVETEVDNRTAFPAEVRDALVRDVLADLEHLDEAEEPGRSSGRLRGLGRALRRQVRWFSGLCILIAAVACAAFFLLDAARTTWADLELPAVGVSKRATPARNVFAELAASATHVARDDWARAARIGAPFGTVPGLLGFRGNPTRSLYGTGPVPNAPEAVWQYPDSAMCGTSPSRVSARTRCGTGWTGQPAVFERDGRTWLVFGAYDRKVHFVDARTGVPILAPFETGDYVNGSVTVDPDGFPLVYFGSDDGSFRVVAFDGGSARELWRLNASDVSPTMWNDDWDSSALVVDDHLIVAGENGQLHIVRLGRTMAIDGRVRIAPELVFNTPAWDDELLDAVGDREVSIESSPTIVGSTLYLANSAGLVQGWDIGGLRAGAAPTRTFRFWSGDDTDATIVADTSGALYVAAQRQRANERSEEVGQLFKLDPTRSDPLVWTVETQGAGGIWATPALVGDLLYVPTYAGSLLAVDRSSGEIVWQTHLDGPLVSSPVAVDGVLVQADCSGSLHAFDVTTPDTEPERIWSRDIGGCIESTPAVWEGHIYAGTGAGYMRALADTEPPAPR